jgi:anti-sigma B factor antagonist
MAIELDFERSEHDDWRVLAVTGEIDAYTSPRLREELRHDIDGGARRIVVDLRGVEFMDSTGLGVLVSALKRVKEGGGGEVNDDGRLSLVCTSPQILRVLSVTGLDKVFVVAPSVAEASAS